ncbi:MAG: hypothetical protein RLZZ262_882 [Bacteroidota bacterium]|jgi:exodeoxyribonuclease III
MKLITWNCQGAFRKKADIILQQRPDILVVQECEHPDRLKFSATTPSPDNFYWYSDGGKKGIGLFSYSGFKFELLSEFNPTFRYILPFRVTGNGHSITLIAVWAMNNKENRRARYIGQVWLAINHYKDLIGKSTILIGDFNSNRIWDKKDGVGNHSDVVNRLAERGIHSVYHKYFNVEHGQEDHPTFFLHRNKEKPYHIDYCFASADLYDKVASLELGTYENWMSHSDHIPLEINLEI